MDFSSAVEFIKQFETTKIMAYIKAMDLKTIMEHPYFLAGVGVTAIIAYLMKWRLLLVVVMTITGFVYLLGYTLSKGVSLEGGMPTQVLTTPAMYASYDSDGSRMLYSDRKGYENAGRKDLQTAHRATSPPIGSGPRKQPPCKADIRSK